MAHARLVDVLDARHKLLVYAHCSLLMQTLMLHDIVEEFTIWTELHDEVKLGIGLDDFVKLDHVLMPNFL